VNSQACADCFIAAGMSASAGNACVQGVVVTPGSTGYGDCDAMQEAVVRSNCLDEHDGAAMRIVPAAAALMLGAAFVSVGVAAPAHAGREEYCNYLREHGLTARVDCQYLCAKPPCSNSLTDKNYGADGDLPVGCDPTLPWLP
jgi:hypothetical protein